MASKKKYLYCLFRRDENGNLVAMYDRSTMSMGWADNVACSWHEPPIHYFDPSRGMFIVKITRKNPDIEFTGRKDKRGNLEWKEISIKEEK